MEAQELKNKINQLVDQWVSEVLRSRFLQKPHDIERRSLWDKFKQGLTNWWWGPEGDEKNKYRWRNRFGDELGVTESFSPEIFSLQEYRDIKGVVDSVELQINENEEEFDNLRLMKIVRSAAEKLKDMLFNGLVGRVEEIPTQNSAVEERPKTPSSDDGAVGGGSGGQGGRTSLVTDPRAKTAGPVTPAAGASAEDGAASGAGKEDAAAPRKTNRQRIQDAIEEIVGMNSSDRAEALKPKQNWLDEGGRLKKDRIPYLLAWMSMKTHHDPLNDDDIRRNLKDALGKDVDLGLPKTVGSLKDYLKRTLLSDFDEAMNKIGVGTHDEQGKATKPEGTEGEEGVDLSGFLYKDGRPRSIKESLLLLYGFIKPFYEKLEKDKAKRLFDWWNGEMEMLRQRNQHDIMDHLRGSLLMRDDYLKKISDLSGVEKKSVEKQMHEFILSKSED